VADSLPPALTKLFPQLGYRDPEGAIAWLKALGFELLLTWPYPDGGLRHAELRLGDAIVMVGGAREELQQPELRGRTVGHGTYVHTPDVPAMYKAAIDAGATSVFEPEPTEWGTERARVLDPEGYEWSFGNYEPGQD
jgi:uncharacterized glyoxalase superfamily protein PhnB